MSVFSSDVSRYQTLHDKEKSWKNKKVRKGTRDKQKLQGQKGDREEWILHAPDREKNGWRVVVMVFLCFLFLFLFFSFFFFRHANEHLESSGR